jgi:hypothetical protein
MSYRFSCPRCNRVYDGQDGAAGRKFDCSCGQRLEVPATPLPPPNKTVLGKVEEPAKEPLVQCYVCGRRVAKIERREIKTGSSRGMFNLGNTIGSTNAARYSIESVCLRCCKELDDEKEDTVKVATTLCVGAAVFAIVAVIAILLALWFSRPG